MAETHDYQSVYVIGDVTADMLYVGSSIHTSQRIRSHKWALRNNEHSNYQLQRAYNKGHSLQLLVLPIQPDVNVRMVEKTLIDELMPKGVLYNLTTDTVNPMQGRKHSDETKAKMSLARTGKKRSEEAKANMSLAQQKRAETTVPSDEFREKCRQRMLGHSPSEETRRRLSEAGMGRKHSEASRQKMSDSTRGKPKTDAHRESIHQANLKHAKPVIIDSVRYESYLDASKKTGITLSTVAARAKRGEYENG